MIDVYNSLLDLARERLDELTGSREAAPSRMPHKDEVVDAMSRMVQDRYAIPNPVSDPVLKRCLLRILQINSLVLADALVSRRSGALVGVGGSVEDIVEIEYVSWPGAISGEMSCLSVDTEVFVT